jgi:ketosteroid isomerase-like protein
MCRSQEGEPQSRKALHTAFFYKRADRLNPASRTFDVPWTMHVRLFLFLSVVLWGVGTGHSSLAQGNRAAEEEAIRKGDAEWSHAADTKDLEKTVSFYAEDGSVLPFGAAIATGKEQVRQVWSHLMSLPGYSLTFAPTTVQVAKAGDIAYEVGAFALKLNDAQGNATTTPGKYVVVWKKQADRGRKAVADIFNTDK